MDREKIAQYEKARNHKSARQEGITMRIERPKIEVSNLDGAVQGSKIIQIIWFNLLWSILLGPQLSPVSSVLLLDIIFIDWLKVRKDLNIKVDGTKVNGLLTENSE